MSDTVPSDYDPHDGWDDEFGCDQCPHCETGLWPNTGYDDVVIDQDGNRYEHITDTELYDAPFFCPDCWDELETNRRAAENAAITEWS